MSWKTGMRAWIAVATGALVIASLELSIARAAKTETDPEAPLIQAAGASAKHVGDRTDAMKAIASCLEANREAVLLSHYVLCMEYRKGSELLKQAGGPAGFVASKNCSKEAASASRFDARRLGSDAIQQLARKPEKIGRRGIRILNAIFCDPVQLIGFELPFSLVIDRSIFNEDVEIRNFITKGDLSIDGSLLLKSLRMLRSHISGSLFGNEAFINGLTISTSTIDGELYLMESVLLRYAQFDNVTVGGGLSVRGSALSYFIAQFSHIHGPLDLSQSQARCAYHINQSDMDFLVAKNAGFGRLLTQKRRSSVQSPRFISGGKHLGML